MSNLRCVIADVEKEAVVVNIQNDIRDIEESIGARAISCNGHIDDDGCLNVYYDATAKERGELFNRHYKGENYYGAILINRMEEQDQSLTDEQINHLLDTSNNPSAFELQDGFSMGEMK